VAAAVGVRGTAFFAGIASNCYPVSSELYFLDSDLSRSNTLAELMEAIPFSLMNLCRINWTALRWTLASIFPSISVCYGSRCIFRSGLSAGIRSLHGSRMQGQGSTRLVSRLTSFVRLVYLIENVDDLLTATSKSRTYNQPS
jgi:hypothetical protein